MSGPHTEDPSIDVPPMGWQNIGAGRWRKVDEIGTMHLLLRHGRGFFELHGLTVHVYDGPADVPDDTNWPLGDPYEFDPATYPYQHRRTEDMSSSALTAYKDESDAWDWLERYASVEYDAE